MTLLHVYSYIIIFTRASCFSENGNFFDELLYRSSFHARVANKRFSFFFFLFIRYFLNCSFLILFPARMEEEKDATNAQILWSACTALARAIKSGPPGAPIEKIVRPLESEIKAVCKAARKYNLNSICGTMITSLVHLLYFK